MNWHFHPSTPGLDIQGIRDGDIENFDKLRYSSVVRESIQNSLDARLKKDEPVRVEFEFFSIPKDEYPDVFSIEDRINAGAMSNQFTYNKDDQEVYVRMLEKINSNGNTIPVLRISDYNTIGMDKEENYESFAMARNLSVKQSDGSAGSKGMGKAAYFSLSYLRSILVSSISHRGNYLFQGISRLSTHTFNGENYWYKGFLGIDEFNVVENPEAVHTVFQRSECGTSIFILGVWDDEDRDKKMLEALLNNFWLAIYEKELEVSFQGYMINDQNISKLIEQHFSTIIESGRYNVKGNPRPYFDTYKQKGLGKTFQEKINYVGWVKLFLAKNNDYQGRVAFFRKSKMLINKERLLFKGYCGVFVCDDEQGNEILKKLENARHDEWDAGNWPDPRARKVLKEIRDFIGRSFEHFSGNQETTELTIPELADFINLNFLKKKINGPKEGSSGKAVSKPKKIPLPKEGEDLSPGRIRKIFSYAFKKEPDEWWYKIIIQAKKNLPNGQFEILVGSDSDSISDDNRIPLKSISRGSFNSNVFVLNVFEGENEVDVLLNDTIKHSVKIKYIQS